MSCVLFRGWRTTDIERTLDAVVNYDGPLYQEGVRPSEQKGYMQDYRHNYHVQHKTRENRNSLTLAHSEFGSINQRTVWKAILKIKDGKKPYYRSKKLTADMFESVKEFMINRGKLKASDNLPSGELYVKLLEESIQEENERKKKPFQSLHTEKAVLKKMGSESNVVWLVKDFKKYKTANHT